MNAWMMSTYSNAIVVRPWRTPGSLCQQMPNSISWSQICASKPRSTSTWQSSAWATTWPSADTSKSLSALKSTSKSVARSSSKSPWLSLSLKSVQKPRSYSSRLKRKLKRTSRSRWWRQIRSLERWKAFAKERFRTSKPNAISTCSAKSICWLTLKRAQEVVQLRLKQMDFYWIDSMTH